VTRLLLRALRGRLRLVRRALARRGRRVATAARVARVRLGPRAGVVFAFHGVVERVEDRDVQLNHVDVAAFRRALEAVTRRFDVVGLEELVAGLAGGPRRGRPRAALTFDDGYASTLELVHPLLSASGLPYAVFVCPGLTDAGARLPSFVAHAAVRFTSVAEPVLPHAGPLRLADARSDEAWRVVELVKRLPQRSVEELVRACRSLLADDEWAALERRFASERLLGWDEVRALARAGAAVGSHTLDHAALHAGQPPEELERQVVGAKERLEAELGVACALFCYPYGRYEHLSPAGVAAVRTAGHRVGLTLETGTLRKGMSPHVLPRVYVGPKLDPRRLDGLLAATRDRLFVRETRRLGLV